MATTKTLEKILFNTVNNIGEIQNDQYQIIDVSESMDEIFGEKKFKVYHSYGYCFDIEKLNLGTDDNGIHLGYDYIIYDEYEGFKKASTVYYIKILG